MLIECIIKRDGPTEIVYDRFAYRFRANEHGHAVCEVRNPGHVKQFLRFPKSFRVYNPERPSPAPVSLSSTREPEGFSSSLPVSPPLDDTVTWPTNETVITEDGNVSEYVKEKLKPVEQEQPMDKKRLAQEIVKQKDQGKSFTEIGKMLGINARQANGIFQAEKRKTKGGTDNG